MGQSWEIINIDKREKMLLVSRCKWGEIYLGFPYDAIQCLARGNSWAGDRIILIGDYAFCFPPGVMNEGEKKDLDADNLDLPGITSYEPFSWPRQTRNVALRNLNSREYITDHLFPGTLLFVHFLPHRSCRRILLILYRDEEVSSFPFPSITFENLMVQ
jgi:hypothetical protein